MLTGNPVRQIQCRGSQVFNLHVGPELILCSEKMNNIRAERIVAEQYVAHPANQYAFHRIFAVAIFRPAGSNA